jgi:hypothetical protein
MKQRTRAGGSKVARNETLPKSSKIPLASQKIPCSNCGGSLEPVGNRYFIMYKRAHLPQPRTEALVCQHCGWVEGDEVFKALLEERIK